MLAGLSRLPSVRWQPLLAMPSTHHHAQLCAACHYVFGSYRYVLRDLSGNRAAGLQPVEALRSE